MDENAPPAPPIEEPMLPEQPAKWPTVFGVIGIILASLGLLGGCCGALAPLAMPRYIAWLEAQEGMPQEQIDIMKASMPPVAWTMLASLVGLAVSIILLMGAIKILRRRSAGIGLCKFWAWFTIPWSLVGFAVNLMLQMRVPTSSQPAGAVGKYISLGFGGCWVLVLGVGLPLFALYWFTREPVRAEIRDWDEERMGLI
jgi:hypothetical protein